MRFLTIAVIALFASAALCQEGKVGVEPSHKVFKGSPKYDEIAKAAYEPLSLKDLIERIAKDTGLALSVNARAALDPTSYSVAVADQPLRLVLDSIAKLAECVWKTAKDGGYVLRGKTNIATIDKKANPMFGAITAKQWETMDERGYLDWDDLSPQQQAQFHEMAHVEGAAPGQPGAMAVIRFNDDNGNTLEIHIGGE